MARSDGFLGDMLHVLDLLWVRAKLDEEKSSDRKEIKVSIYPYDLKPLGVGYERCREALVFLLKSKIINDISRVYEAEDFIDNDYDEPKLFDIALPFNFESNLKKSIRDIQKELELDNEPSISTGVVNEKIIFKDNILMCGEKRHVFHAKSDKGLTLLKAMNILWPLKRIINGKKITRGEPLQKGQFAIDLGVSTDAPAFYRYPENRVKFNNIVKALKRIFREKDFPVELNITEENIQLVIRGGDDVREGGRIIYASQLQI